MIPGLIILFVVLIVALVLYYGKSPIRQRTRPEFLNDMARFLEGKLETIEGKENSFKIDFSFEGRDCVYEDVYERGLNRLINKGYLKMQTGKAFNLLFSERKQSTAIRREIIVMSKIPEGPQQKTIKVDLPKELDSFHVETNDPEHANKLFKNSKLFSFFLECKNIDARGCPYMSSYIRDGVITVEFHSVGTLRPSLHFLYSNIPSMDEYLYKMSQIAEFLLK